jgi:hypothetical protein
MKPAKPFQLAPMPAIYQGVILPAFWGQAVKFCYSMHHVPDDAHCLAVLQAISL